MKNNIFRTIILFIATSLIVVYFIPKDIVIFNYKYTEGKPWVYESLYSPFDFLIRKSKAEIEKEKKILDEGKRIYFKYDVGIRDDVFLDLKLELNNNKYSDIEKDKILEIIKKSL